MLRPPCLLFSLWIVRWVAYTFNKQIKYNSKSCYIWVVKNWATVNVSQRLVFSISFWWLLNFCSPGTVWKPSASPIWCSPRIIENPLGSQVEKDLAQLCCACALGGFRVLPVLQGELHLVDEKQPNLQKRPIKYKWLNKTYEARPVPY